MSTSHYWYHVAPGEHPKSASGNPPTRRRNERHYPESRPVTEGRMTERHIEELAEQPPTP